MLNSDGAKNPMQNQLKHLEHGDDGDSQIKRKRSADIGQEIHAGHLGFLLDRFNQFCVKINLFPIKKN